MRKKSDFTCPVCDQTFQNEEALREHMKHHTGVSKPSDRGQEPKDNKRP